MSHKKERLLLLPQRYVFSSKSQQEHFALVRRYSCCCYHKGTYFQANHNLFQESNAFNEVVVDTTKVRIFKQITTINPLTGHRDELLLLPQRYVFSSKSQPIGLRSIFHSVVVATTKVRIFKQITTVLAISTR